jgi:hypothetical protein
MEMLLIDSLCIFFFETCFGAIFCFIIACKILSIVLQDRLSPLSLCGCAPWLMWLIDRFVFVFAIPFAALQVCQPLLPVHRPA